jgi:hypothetical protein
MSSISQDHSNHSDSSMGIEQLEEMMWEGINNPLDVEVEAEIETDLEA